MGMKCLIRQGITGLGFLGLLAGVTCADEVVLRTGAVLTGETEPADGLLLLRMAHGEIRIPTDQIERIVESVPPAATYARRLSDLDCSPGATSASHDAGAHVELARWCEANGMGGEARAQYECALAHDPADARALAAIGCGEGPVAEGAPAGDPPALETETDEEVVEPRGEADPGRSDRRALREEIARLRQEMARRRREEADRERRELLRRRREIVVYGPGYAWSGFPTGTAYIGPNFIGRSGDGENLVAPWPGSLPSGLCTIGNYSSYGLGLRIRYENQWRGGSLVIDTGP